MLVCAASFCDLVVWTEVDIVTVRVRYDHAFANSCLEKAEFFFNNVVLPELCGNLFTKGRQHESAKTMQEINTVMQKPATDKGAQAPLSAQKPGKGLRAPLSPQKTPSYAQTASGVCFCKQDSQDNTITCVNENCSIWEFHRACVKIKRKPSVKVLQNW